MQPAIFIDRDGVINQNRADYVKSWKEFIFLPPVFEALRKLAGSKYRVILITNQSVIGRGIVAASVIHEIHHNLMTEILAQGGRIDGIYYCPHRPDEGCACRKPKPGLLLTAAAEHQIDILHSFMIGDAISDVETALKAGCFPVMVLTGRGKQQLSELNALREHCRIEPDLLTAVNWILEQRED